jgi:hypothetical protein
LLVAARPEEKPLNNVEKDHPGQLIPSLEDLTSSIPIALPVMARTRRVKVRRLRHLIAKLPDLTTISRRNGGIFPTSRIEHAISGDEIIIAHCSREMPVWGPIFHQIEQDRDFGNVRLHNITHCLETIQQK